MAKLSAIDLFNMLTTDEQQKVLTTLERNKPSACQRLGHSFKPVREKYKGWFDLPVKVCVCSRCGESIER